MSDTTEHDANQNAEPVAERMADTVGAPPPIRARFVLVLGMHRSGTSLLTSLITSAGAHPGSQLLEASNDNPRGYFEDVRLIAFHDACLSARGVHYMDLLERPPVFTADETVAAQALRDALADEAWQSITADDPSHRPTVVIKDPRACHFAAEWLGVLPEARAVVVYRHPCSVLASLLRRNEPRVIRDPTLGPRLWLQHNQAALRAIEALPHDRKRVLCIDDLFASPEHVCRELAELGIGLAPERLASIAHRDELADIRGADAALRWMETVAPGLKETLAQLDRLACRPAVSETARARFADADAVPLFARATAFANDRGGSGFAASGALAFAALMLMDQRVRDRYALRVATDAAARPRAE